jgi:hypothetical protein
MGISPGWALSEVKRDDWWISDCVSGSAYEIPSAVAERLWRCSGLRVHPWDVALRAVPAEPDDPFVDLEYLGEPVRYLCEDTATADRLAELYAAMLPEHRRAPDVLVKIGRTADFDRLHRSVLGTRDGVHVRCVTEAEWEPGSADLPIIPALQTPGLRGRYCGIHAALLSTTEGGILICGAQRAGKTSAAVLARNSGAASVLTDELVLINEAGDAFGVPLPVRERTGADRAVSPLRKLPAIAHQQARRISAVVALSITKNAPAWEEISSTADQLRLISPHLRPLDGPLGRATVSVLNLLRNAKVWSWRQRPWPSLIDDLRYGCERLLGLSVGIA